MKYKRTWEQYAAIIDDPAHTRADLDEVAKELNIPFGPTVSMDEFAFAFAKMVEEHKDIVEIDTNSSVNINEIADMVAERSRGVIEDKVNAMIAKATADISDVVDQFTEKATNIIDRTNRAVLAVDQAEEDVLQRVIQRITIVGGRTVGEGGEAKITVGLDNLVEAAGSIPVKMMHYVNPYPDHWDRWNRMSLEDMIINVTLKGATGTGKTTFGMQYAANYERPCFIQDCSVLVEPDQFFGMWIAKDGTTSFEISPLMRAIQIPRSVIILDEANRTAHPKVNNALVSMTDFRRYCDTPAGRIHVAPGVTIFTTVNEGPGYVGTDATDLALTGRFVRHLWINHLPYEEEVGVVHANTGLDKKACQKIVKLGGTLRAKYDAISPRTLIACAEEMVYGATFTDACVTTFAGVCNSTSVVMEAIKIEGLD